MRWGVLDSLARGDLLVLVLVRRGPFLVGECSCQLGEGGSVGDIGSEHVVEGVLHGVAHSFSELVDEAVEIGWKYREERWLRWLSW